MTGINIALADVYTVLTPFGTAQALFPPDSGFRLYGPTDAVAHVQDIMRHAVNADGGMIAPTNVEPEDFYYFCQPKGGAITIIPPLGVVFDNTGETSTMDSAATPFDKASPDQASTVAGLRVEFQSAGTMRRLGILQEVWAVRQAAIDAAKTKKFYVTMLRDGQPRPAFLAGPFDAKEQAEAMVPRAREEAEKADPRSAFDAFGVSGVTADKHPPGVLNERLGLDKDGAPMTEDAPPTPRNPTAHLYNFDPNRKKSQRQKDNTAAMALLKQIDAGTVNGDTLTDAQKATLAKYSGTGGALIGADGKKGSAYEYYTPKPIAEGMWDLARELGFSGGKVLDPSAGVGIFGGTAPADAAIDAVELNETSGRINGLVNNGPGYTATISPFEKVAAATPDETYDCVMTNVPFGGVADRGGNQLLDKRYQNEPLQNYFILRSLEKLKPGGLALFITPPRCVSGKGGKEEDLRVRASFMAEFLGAYRLPNLVFGTADADTMTDVIVFRKFAAGVREKVDELREQSPETLTAANVQWQPFIEGRYFEDEGKGFVLGTLATAKNRFGGDMTILNSDMSVAEIAKLLRKFPGSRIDWAMLDATETAPIVYSDGDTITQAGETLRLEDGRWVPLKKTAEDTDTMELLGKASNPYAAFEAGIKWVQAQDLVRYLLQTSQAMVIPDWLRSAYADLQKLQEADRGGIWTAGLVGMAVQQVLDERLGDGTQTNFLTEFPALSDAMVKAWPTAKNRPAAISGRIKDGFGALLNHYGKKTGYSAVWRGDVLATVGGAGTSADSSFEGLRYQARSPWVPLVNATAIYGDGFDPFADPEWCISADGKSVTRAADFYVGNYADMLRNLDQQIAAAEPGPVREKLARMKLDAATWIDRVETKEMTFNLFSPHVTIEEKAEFMRRFVDPRFAVLMEKQVSFTDPATGKRVTSLETVDPYIGLDVTKYENDKDRLIGRFAQYLKNGTVTLGSADFGMSRPEALKALKQQIATANEQFNSWVKSNRAITDRLERIANDPEKLRFRLADEETIPITIPGINPDFAPHGYQAAYVRRQGREFGGINGFGVGLGKTATALASVQHVQSMGVKKKTGFVVPNSVLSNWRKEAVTGAGVKGEPGYKPPVYASGDDCLFIGLRISKDGKPVVDSANYDADLTTVMENRHSKIFMSLEAFERIKLRAETIQAYDAYLRMVDASYAESENKKEDEQNKSKKAGLIEALSSKTGSAPYFEDMGFDSLVFDEAHTMKNSTDTADFKGAKYLSLAGSSGRGIDAQAKAWYIRGQSAIGDGVLLLTATPITNSPLEIYSMLSLAVGRERVNNLCVGTRGADQFMETMCEVQTEADMTMDGIPVEINVFQGLNNVPILRRALGEIAVIKDAEDVGEQIIVPEADEKQTNLDLPDEVIERLKLYQGAYRYARDNISEREENRGDPAAYAIVADYFGEPEALIGHPFNLMRKMEKLILDPELDRLATFYSFPEDQADLAAKVVAQFNAKKIAEKRARPGPKTSPDMVVGRKVKKNEETGETSVELKVQVRAVLDGSRVVIDTITPGTQSAFELFAEKAGLDLDVSVPSKLGALLANFQDEQANPRGVDDEGNKLPIVKQIIFCDALAMHNKIRMMLAKRAGVPASAIAIITGQTNNSPDEILAVQDGFNANGEGNKYRVIIANEKAEVGINLQKGTQAIHHLTIGETPDSLIQRNGRGVRQGNRTGKVNVYYYDAGGTFDSAKRTMVNHKADWIGEVMDVNGAGSVKVSGGMTADQADLLVSLIGDADGMAKMQQAMAAKEAETRAATNRDKQLVNIATITKQNEFLAKNPSPKTWAIQKIYAYGLLKQQAKNLRYRAANARTDTARAKSESSLATVEAKMAGLKAAIEGGCEIKMWGSDSKTLDDFVDFFTGSNKWRKFTEENVVEKLGRGEGVTVAEDSQLANEWQAEADMARAMVDESIARFKQQAAESGAYPAAVVDEVAAGNGEVVYGKPIVARAFIRTKDGLLLVVGTGKNWATRRLSAEGFDPTRGGLVNRTAADASMGGEIFYPGGAGYDDCLTEAAGLEDRIAEIGSTDQPYSKSVPEVAARCKADKPATYKVNDKLLPPPYFPYVITESTAKYSSALIKSIFEKQRELVKRTGYGDFVVLSSVPVVDMPNDFNLDMALIEWAYPQGHLLTMEDLQDKSSAVSKYISKHVNFDEFKATLSGDTEAAAYESAAAFIKGRVKWFDWESTYQTIKAFLPVEFKNAVDSFLAPAREAKRLADEAERARLEAEAKANEKPDDVVGVTGHGTRQWKDDLKRYGERYKPPAHSRGYWWDGDAKQWNISRAAWDKFITDNPSAKSGLSLVKGTKRL